MPEIEFFCFNVCVCVCVCVGPTCPLKEVVDYYKEPSKDLLLNSSLQTGRDVRGERTEDKEEGGREGQGRRGRSEALTVSV